MTNENDERQLRKIYSEIINGFSIHKYNSRDIYVKHSSSLDSLEVDYLYNEHYKDAVEKGYPTEEERIKLLKRDGLWDDSKDKQIEGLKANIESLVTVKRKEFILRNINSLNEQIKESQELLYQIILDKDKTIGSTAEKYAKRQVDAFYISRTFFKDRELKELLLSPEEFEEISPGELNHLYEVHYAINGEMSEETIKKIALKDFFMNVFSLAENLYQFFGKPIAALTYNQIQLCAYGNFFKTILTGEPKPPKDVAADPNKLEDWYFGRANAEEAIRKLNKDGQEGASLVGLKKEDREFLGIENPARVETMADKIKKSGGELSMQEIMRIDQAL